MSNDQTKQRPISKAVPVVGVLCGVDPDDADLGQLA